MSLENEAAEGSVQISYGISEETCPYFKIQDRGNLTIYKIYFCLLNITIIKKEYEQNYYI